MTIESSAYIRIPLSILPKELGTFPFHLYLQTLTSDYTCIVTANTVLFDEIRSKIETEVRMCGKLAIHRSQRRTFLEFLGIKESHLWTPNEELRSWNDISSSIRNEGTNSALVQAITPIEPAPSTAIAPSVADTSWLSYADQRPATTAPETNLDTVEASIAEALLTGNYLSIILAARDEIQKLPTNVGPMLSNAIFLAEKLLNEDTLDNRIVAITYFFARMNHINALSDLGELLCAAFFHDIGLTLIDASLLTQATRKHDYDGEDDYRKHVGLTQHLIQKSGIYLSDRCMAIIADHHERIDGRGFPSAKTDTSIDPLAHYLAIVDHAIHFSSGRINGIDTRLDIVAQMIMNGSSEAGLDTHFPSFISEAFHDVFVHANGLKAIEAKAA